MGARRPTDRRQLETTAHHQCCSQSGVVKKPSLAGANGGAFHLLAASCRQWKFGVSRRSIPTELPIARSAALWRALWAYTRYCDGHFSCSRESEQGLQIPRQEPPF